MNVWRPLRSGSVVNSPLVPEPQSTVFSSTVHVNVASSLESHDSLSRCLFVVCGTLLVKYPRGPVVSGDEIYKYF